MSWWGCEGAGDLSIKFTANLAKSLGPQGNTDWEWDVDVKKTDFQ